MWNFGSWKTFKSFEEAYSVDDNTYVIANVPYSRVNLFYSTEENLLNVIKLQVKALWSYINLLL